MKDLTLIFLGFCGIIILIMSLILLEKSSHPIGTRYLLKNGIEGKLIDYKIGSRDWNDAKYHIQWTEGAITFEAWFKSDEITKIGN